MAAEFLISFLDCGSCVVNKCAQWCGKSSCQEQGCENRENYARHGDAIRSWLMQWARWCRSWAPRLGYPRAVPYIHGRMPLVPPGYAEEGDASAETDDRIDAFAMRVLNSGVENLPRSQYHALRYRYFTDQAPPSVRGEVIEKYRQLIADAEDRVQRFAAAHGLQI